MAALDRDAGRDAAVDIGEGQDLVLAIVPADAPEDTNVSGKLLLTVDVEAIFVAGAADRGHHVVDIQRGIIGLDRQCAAIAAGIAAIDEGTDAQLAGLVEDLVTLLEFDDRAA